METRTIERKTLEVWKFEIPVDDDFTLALPRGAQILHVDDQLGIPHIWALVDPESSLENRTFRLAGTGHPIKVDLEQPCYILHLGTFKMEGGLLIFHLFETQGKTR